MTNAVLIESLSKSFGKVQALKSIDLVIDEGQYVVLLGPSGSGKTTLLSILGGFLGPTSGRICLRGQDITGLPPAKRPTATVFQDYALFPHMSVRDNVAFGLRMRRMAKRQVDDAVDRMLELVGLGNFGDRKINQMSGGQRQRIALARALVIEPVVLLLDEPLGALDLHLRRRMQEEIHRLQRKIGSIFIHVTHDQEEAMSLADKVVVMRQGNVEDCGSPRRVYLHPATSFTATFMGSSNLLNGIITDIDDGQALVETALGHIKCATQQSVHKGTAAQVSLRPEHLRLMNGSAEPALVKGNVSDLVFHGTHMRLSVTPEGLDDMEITVTASADLDVEIGAFVELVADHTKATLLCS
ncbi:MAG: ABC transporter ATP-binding protein [Pseudomonadota bacterium]